MADILELDTGEYNFDIKAGATFNRFVTLYLPKVDPLDPDELPVLFPLDNFTGRAQIRRNAGTVQHYDMTVTILGDGLLQLGMTDEETALIACGNLITDTKSRYQWALELEHSSGYVLRPLEGTVRISAELVK